MIQQLYHREQSACSREIQDGTRSNNLMQNSREYQDITRFNIPVQESEEIQDGTRTKKSRAE